MFDLCTNFAQAPSEHGAALAVEQNGGVVWLDDTTRYLTAVDRRGRVPEDRASVPRLSGSFT